MFKRDPLSPVRSYIGNYAWPGIGLFLEGYGALPVVKMRSKASHGH